METSNFRLNLTCSPGYSRSTRSYWRLKSITSLEIPIRINKPVRYRVIKAAHQVIKLGLRIVVIAPVTKWIDQQLMVSGDPTHFFKAAGRVATLKAF